MQPKLTVRIGLVRYKIIQYENDYKYKDLYGESQKEREIIIMYNYYYT